MFDVELVTKTDSPKVSFSIIGRWHESESYFPIDCDVVKVIQHRYRKIED